MIYELGAEMIFRTDDGALWHKNTPDEITILTATPSRILVLLLEHCGKPLSRDFFYTHVWDDYGLQASNNSLTQYISLLRKSLTVSEESKEVIQTVPGVGYMVAEDAVLLMNDDIHPLIKSHIASTTKLNIAMFMTFVISTILLLASSPSLIPNNSNNIGEHLKKIGDIDDCPVYGLKTILEELRPIELKLAKELSTEHVPCIKNSYFIFNAEERFIYSKKGRVFMSRCINNATNDIATCLNVYAHEK